MSRGFDAFVGNPPFLGGTLIGGQLGLAYHDYLVEAYAPATGLADLVAFFLRRGFGLVRDGGALGFVATNTVAQGDTRSTGLEGIVRSGGVIYGATRRYPWPGESAVVVSVVHICKGHIAPIVLNGRQVERVSSFLLASKAEGAPAALNDNANIGYAGAKVWGSGFLFEPEPANGSSSLADMDRLIGKDPRNRDVIFPYIGGEEFNEQPGQTPIRFVIDFGRMAETQARQWPALFELVEERVKPIRATNKQRNYREEWWLHANRAAETAPYVREHGRLLALSKVSKHLALAFLEGATVAADTILLLCLHRYADFAVLQSRVHEVWARFLGSTLEERLRYTTPCFDTFPRPPHSAVLETIGTEYYSARVATMKAREEGLTKTYNRFHDVDERSADILKLRELHAQMDRVVLDAYGWTDIKPIYDFREQLDESVRLTWDDDTRDEVLARLLELNRVLAEKSPKEGAKKPPATKPDAKKPGAKKKGKTRSLALPGVEPEDT